jgi:hypothetical protein
MPTDVPRPEHEGDTADIRAFSGACFIVVRRRKPCGGQQQHQECLIVGLPLEEINGIDFTGVQAGPACTQLPARFGVDALKVELYFRMLNSSKKSLHGAKVV